MNLPNKLTMLRVILVPVFMVFAAYSRYGTADFNPTFALIAGIIFAVASFTDFLDGYLARKNNLVTDFGKFMDPLADKCLTTAAFIYMVVWRSEAGGLNEIQAAEDDVLYYNMNLDINMRNVATAVIILSTLGAVLDMALTVTTSVYEISIHKPEMKLTELVESGMQIGREVIGTTVNTLLFAYLGESLLLFSYLKMQDYTLETLLNSKILFQNCVSMIFGAIACVVVMPVAAVLVGKRINIV